MGLVEFVFGVYCFDCWWVLVVGCVDVCIVVVVEGVDFGGEKMD